MSKFSFTTKTSTSLATQSSSNAPVDYVLSNPQVSRPVSRSTSLGPSSTWQPPPGWNLNNSTSSNVLVKKSYKLKNRTAEEEEITKETAARFASRLSLDHIDVLYPDTDSPFTDTIDVVNRLLPYHVFQHPGEDLDCLLRDGKGKGKGKAADDHLVEEIAETKFALECFKRRKNLHDRFRRVRTKSGRRSAPDHQAYVLAQAVLEASRHETTSLNAEVRNARAEMDRIERAKRLTSMPSRPTYYSAHHSGPQAQYYGGYSYGFAQPYGSSLPPSSNPAAVTSGSPSTVSSAFTPPLLGAIPVQLPVASLPALHALGIVPVPAASLPPSNQSQPPAVLRGSTANGTMLSLEINVSLLQSAQMSGLAMVLNSLMSRGVSSNIASSLETAFGNGGTAGSSSVGATEGG